MQIICPLRILEGASIPIQKLRCSLNPILTSTYTAHVVNPYTNASGKQLAAAQHSRSQRSAHARGRRFGHEGEVGGDEARVAMVCWLSREREAGDVHRVVEYGIQIEGEYVDSVNNRSAWRGDRGGVGEGGRGQQRGSGSIAAAYCGAS
jgi:hypothetical protein